MELFFREVTISINFDSYIVQFKEEAIKELVNFIGINFAFRK